MADTAEKIIDLAAYRVRKRAAALGPSIEPFGQTAVTTFPLYGFWLVWVWMPIAVPAMFAGERNA